MLHSEKNTINSSPTTKYFIKITRAFYGTAIVVYGLQQLYYGDFRNVQLPPWQYHIPALNIVAYITGAGLIIAGLAIIFEKNARQVSLVLGGVFLLLCCFVHVPYELISEPNKTYHLGLWESTLKELALAGGAFVVADSLNSTQINIHQKNSIIKILEKLIPYGGLFFCITITTFGIAHFMYLDSIAVMVPAYMPDRTFWAYFAGVALIGSGVFIILDIRKRTIAALLGTMIFLWFIFLHMPNAIKNPTINRGNELASAFDALAFSGTAFLIALARNNKRADTYTDK
ncbi:MAG: hypothetical protein ABJA35_16760 [Parafilimonas sp.]